MELSYTFKKHEKLCLKKQINNLFEHGRWLRSEHLRMIYLPSEDKLPAPAQIMFSVPKRLHRKAVKRNLLKRRLREAYRLNKPNFYKEIEELDKHVLISVLYSSNAEADYKTLKSELTYLLKQLAIRLQRL